MISYNGVVITNLVMTFSKLSPAYKYTISPFMKGLHDKKRINSAGTHNPDSPDVRGILKTGNTRRIGCCVTAPITKKT
jgi:hypothetical protein